MLHHSHWQPKQTKAQMWRQHYAQLARSSQHPLLQQYYQSLQPEPDLALSQQPLLALDLETTGLDPGQDGIVSIGLVPFNAQRIYASQARQYLVKPRFALRSDSVLLHKITHSQIAGAPDLHDVLPELLQQLAGKVVVAHHGVIERSFLSAAVQARWGEPLQFPLIDSYELERRWQAIRPLTLWQRWRGKGPLSLQLAACRERYGLPAYAPHHAATDALACAELLLAQCQTFCPSEPILAELLC
ncbi:3'-5' exonuclease [Rheinheimera marina]|uniref:3'-5' exonuclease n=1 Tax=Rheinheimera marina TaxID=1774958 RepID=A0ABV9JPG2_9GAMM